MAARLSRSTSLYFDVLRLVAALAVLLSHASWNKLSGGFLWPLQPYGHAAVVVFFVLSGFVIAYTASVKDTSVESYALSRLSRLYSVIVPALILSFVADSVGQAINPAPYSPDEETEPLLRIAAAAFFVSHVWDNQITLFSNHSYWSMPYEFWYYVIFAGAFYFRGWRRILVCGGAMLIAGPNILLMFPIWLIGAGVCSLSRTWRIPRGPALVLFIVSLAAILVGEYLVDGRGLVVRHYTPDFPPGFSVADYAIGALVAINILAACSIDLPLERFAGLIRTAAGYTFSIYLYHLPLLHLAAAIIPSDLPTFVRGGLMLMVTMAGVIGLGSVTESRKDTLHAALTVALRALGARFQPKGRLLPAGEPIDGRAPAKQG